MCACPLTPNIVVSEECAVKFVSNAFVTSCCCYPVTSEGFLFNTLAIFKPFKTFWSQRFCNHDMSNICGIF